MKKLPNLQEFKAPDGYFESLPDRIIKKAERAKTHLLIRYAAAASILIFLTVWQVQIIDSPQVPLTLEEEALLYIESNQWSSEDVLGLTENPNEILDQIIQEEFGPLNQFEEEEEDQNWF